MVLEHLQYIPKYVKRISNIKSRKGEGSQTRIFAY
jgi:hypothetical protein